MLSIGGHVGEYMLSIGGHMLTIGEHVLSIAEHIGEDMVNKGEHRPAMW